MDLAAASAYFDRELVYDAYTGSLLFKCQFSSFDDHSSSGATARRRVLSVVPGTVLPPRKAVKIFDTYWIGGNGDTDGFLGTPVRSNFNLKRSTGLVTILTPAEACLAAAGVAAHAHMTPFKETVDTQTSSQYSNYWNVFFPATEPVSTGKFLRFGSTLYRIRNHYGTEDGFTVAGSDQLPADALRAATFTTQGEYNLVTDTYPTVTVATQVVAMEVPKFYRLGDASDDYEKPGDMSVFVAKSVTTPTKGSTVSMGSKAWRVLSVVDELDTWVVRVRRA